jgi:hypothetical protein
MISRLYNNTYFQPAKDYIDRAWISDERERKAVNIFFKDIISIYSKLQTGAFYLVSPSSLGASLINCMNTNYTLTYAIGKSPTFSQKGWAFNGVDQYLKTGLIPNTDLTQFNHFSAIYMRNNTSVSGFDYGAQKADNTASFNFTAKNGSGNTLSDMYNNTTGRLIFATSDSSGFWGVNTSSSSNRVITRNAVNVGSTVSVAGNMTTNEVYVGCSNVDGTPTFFTNREVITFLIAKTAITAGDLKILYPAIYKYNQSVITGGRAV